jgi:hypothetical protein
VEFSGGNRMSKKRMPVGESRRETRTAGRFLHTVVAG